MKVVLKDKGTLVVRFDRGEELVSALERICGEENIDGAYVSGIGSAQRVRLAWYDVDSKEYLEKEIAEKLEVVNLTGNVARKGNEVIVHLHGTLSDREMRPVAGHVASLEVAATLEVIVIKTDALFKERSEKIGLNLLQ
ncbi:MAG: DNA-binding protein [bacterium]|nr:DNA-binding protein [bacterium]MDZ4231973.1 PPC domain-containing DNA-binding protein [Candidatus Pacearchaeota archaeon]